MTRRAITARRKAPATPAEIAARRVAARRQDLEAVNLPAEIAALPSSADIVIARRGPTSVGAARREDVFEALRKGMQPGAYDAARRFENDLLASLALTDRGRPMLRVDGGGALDPAGRVDRMLAARDRLEALVAHLPAGLYCLLQELVAPIGPVRPWREVVRVLTGETHDHAQGAVVRTACSSVRWAWEKVDRTGRA